MTGALLRRPHRDRNRDGQVKIEAEVGVMQPQAKECQQPETTKRQGWILSHTL